MHITEADPLDHLDHQYHLVSIPIIPHQLLLTNIMCAIDSKHTWTTMTTLTAQADHSDHLDYIENLDQLTTWTS